jgi:hypothetical protein
MPHPVKMIKLITWIIFGVGALSSFMVIISHLMEGEICLTRWVTIFFEILLLAVALWFRREASRKNQIDAIVHVDKYMPSWRLGLSLLFFVIGFQGLIMSIASYFPSWQTILFSRAQESLKNDGDKNDILTFMTFIIGIASAYYLVTLQGTWKQARDLLDKLENQKREMDKLKHELNNLRSHESDIIISLAGFSGFLADFNNSIPNVREKNKISLSIHKEILGHVLESYKAIADAQSTERYSRDYLSKIHAEVKTLYNNLDIRQKSIHSQAERELLINYVPNSLLRRIRQHFDQLDYDSLPPEERELVSDTLKYVKKLERLIMG